MKNVSRTFTLSVALILLCSMGAVSAAQMKAGTGKTDITPPLGTPMAGYFYERLATNVHDPLYAKALVLENGEQKMVLVTVDNVAISSECTANARAKIREEFNIPLANIIISATHSHTSPVLSTVYKEMLSVKIYDAVKIAMQNLQPAVIKSGAGKEETVSFHRRYLMKDGTVKFNPGPLNPDIVRPMGPIDPEVGILYLETFSGKPIAVLVNFAIHLDTVGGTEFSADFPHFLGKVLQKVLGDDVQVMFALGTCGNINHFNVKSPETLKGFGRAERIGYALAGSVIKEFPALEKVDAREIKSGNEKLYLKIPEYTKEQVEMAKVNAMKKSTLESSTPEIREAQKILKIQEMAGKPIEAEVQVFGLGDVGIVGLPGEIFVELGMEIKKRSPFKNTFILTLSNSSIGYIPNAEAFDYGAYEVEVSRIAKGEGEKLVGSVVKLLESIKQ